MRIILNQYIYIKISCHSEGDNVVFPSYPNIWGTITRITYERKYSRPRREGRRFYFVRGVQYLVPKYHVQLQNVPSTRFFFEDELDFPTIDELLGFFPAE